jgi:taurine--2-oxoglutarate transaminase
MIPERLGVLHSWCVQNNWDAPTIVGGEGAWFWDESGHRYLDMSSLAECTTLGHQHPAMVRAIREQAEKLCFVTAAWGAEPRAHLAELLLEKSGFEGGRVFFSLGGADANEHAVKFARQAGGKPRGLIITRDRSYHGATFAAMALSGDSRTRYYIDPEDLRVAHVPPPYAYRCPFGSVSEEECGERCVHHIGEVIDEHDPAQVAAVLMEPDAGTNGIVAPDNFWPLVRRETRDRGVYLIADEVMSAFGRCGEWFAWQRYGEEGRPDLMSLAKGLTASYVPLGAVVVSREIAARLENEMLYTGLTYCGHPLACAVGLAALETYEREDLIKRSRALGASLFADLCAMRERVDVIGDVRGGHGLFAIVELVRNRVTRDPISPWPETHPSLTKFVDLAREDGVSFATRGNLIILAPPLVIKEDDLMDALAVMERILTGLEWI